MKTFQNIILKIKRDKKFFKYKNSMQKNHSLKFYNRNISNLIEMKKDSRMLINFDNFLNLVFSK